MDRELMLKYLVYLNDVVGGLVRSADLSRDDLASLDRELRLFREKAVGAAYWVRRPGIWYPDYRFASTRA